MSVNLKRCEAVHVKNFIVDFDLVPVYFSL